METRIRNYEDFIKKASKNPGKFGYSGRELAAYHRFMLQNFQHERLIHLLVTFFFAALALIFLALSVAAGFFLGACEPLCCLPVYALAAILTILTIFYIKHYYFLENHIQHLYDIKIQ